jgi:hypothetical protein
LGELNDSLSYALGAGPLFDVSEDSDYAHALLGELSEVLGHSGCYFNEFTPAHCVELFVLFFQPKH